VSDGLAFVRLCVGRDIIFLSPSQTNNWRDCNNAASYTNIAGLLIASVVGSSSVRGRSRDAIRPVFHWPLVECAWHYRHPARIGARKAIKCAALPKPVVDIAWKAQTRLCARYRALTGKGKKPTVAVTAIARELAAFIWAIAREVQPAACEA
jgi:hypothetical protein